MPKVFVKRGTRAQLNTAASANQLNAGEPYLITDENRIAMGLSASTYEVFAKTSEKVAGSISISVVASLPATPDSNTLYIVTG